MSINNVDLFQSDGTCTTAAIICCDWGVCLVHQTITKQTVGKRNLFFHVKKYASFEGKELRETWMAVSEIQFWNARSCWGTSQFNIKHLCLVWACCVVVQLLLEQPYMDGSVYWRRVPRARRSQERRHRPSKWTDDLAEFVLFLARCGVGWRGWVTWPTLPLDGIPAPSRLILSEQWRLTCRYFFFLLFSFFLPFSMFV